MGIFEHFPYVNFHELNLDWLINDFKAQKVKLDELDKIVTDLVGTVSDEVAAILQEMYDNGDLEALIAAYMDDAVIQYNTFPDIPTSGLTPGTIVRTKGFTSIADGGDAEYIVFSSGAGWFPANSNYTFKIIGDVRPKAAGASADGVTNDITVLQNLLDKYRRIDLGIYTYLINGQLAINNDSCTITGQNAVIKRADGNGNPVLSADNHNKITINGVYFLGGIQTSTSMMVSLTNCNEVHISACKFVQSHGYCMRLSGSSNVNVEDCLFTDVTGASGNPGGGIYIQGGNNFNLDGLIGNNLLDHLVYLDGSVALADINISNCVCKNGNIAGALTNAAAIAIYGGVERVNITNCNFYSIKTGIIIAVRNDTGTTNAKIAKLVTISNCNIRGIDETGIQVYGSSDTMNNSQDIVISNCNIFDCGQDGVDFRYANMAQIANCVIQMIVRYGIAASYSNGIMIIGCNVGNIANGTGIIIGSIGASDNCAINGNLIYKCDQGLYIRSGANNYAGNNNFYGGFTGFPFRSGAGSSVAVNASNTYHGERSIYWSASIPSVGAYRAGDICFDSTGATNGWRYNGNSWVAM